MPLYDKQPKKRFEPIPKKKKIVCALCGRQTAVRIKTPPGKPIYCNSCYRKKKAEPKKRFSLPDHIQEVLTEQGFWFTVQKHKPVFTSEEASRVRGVPLHSGVKAMVLKTGEETLILALLPADKKVDMKQIAALEGTKKVKLATPEEVLKRTGVTIGSVPPFGFEQPIKTYVDRAVFDNEDVNFNIGDHQLSITMHAEDLKTLLQEDEHVEFMNGNG
ncbi:MAG: hypothetical protein KKA90_02010 [Nanoarchaeota archaeon]|nr:hypothetical protein [Nanoarchaeota archaeon]